MSKTLRYNLTINIYSYSICIDSEQVYDDECYIRISSRCNLHIIDHGRNEHLMMSLKKPGSF